jgi:DHA1 family inner membrane transport protein
MRDNRALKRRIEPEAPARDAIDERWRSHALALAVGTFAVGTDAFVIAGILPEIAHSLEVNVQAAGQLVSVFSIAYAISAPLLGTATADWQRRTALVVALVLFAVGNAITASVPGYAMALASRIIAAAGAGLFTANASATAAMLAGPQNRGAAIARVMLGLTMSLVFGAPLGTAMAAAIGWRGTMWFVTGLGILAGILIYARLPRSADARISTLAERLAQLRDRTVVGDLLRTILAFTGVYIPYTYISVVYREAIDSRPAFLGIALLVFGVCGTTGNLLAGKLSDRVGPATVIISGLIGFTIVCILIPFATASVALSLLAVAASGLFSFSLTTPQQALLLSRSDGSHLSVLTALYQSSVYVAVALSGILGAAIITAFHERALTFIAALITACAAVMTWRQTARRDRLDH